MPDRYEALRAAAERVKDWQADVNLYTDGRGQRGIFVALYAPNWPDGRLTHHGWARDYIAEADPTTVRALLAERDRLWAGATAALDALRDWRAGYGDPDNRDGLIDEAGQKLYDALERAE